MREFINSKESMYESERVYIWEKDCLRVCVRKGGAELSLCVRDWICIPKRGTLSYFLLVLFVLEYSGEQTEPSAYSARFIESQETLI